MFGIKKLLLIHTPCSQIEEDNLEPPLGLLQIASVLIKEGYSTNILDLSSTTLDVCKQTLSKNYLDFDYYCFSTYTATYHITKQLANYISKKNNKAITVAGGPHATALSDEVSKDFNHVVCGEGENGMLELLNGNQSKIINSKPVCNLDSLPLPAYDLIDLKNYTRTVNGKKSLSILTTRGCPYNCSFCNSIIFSRNNFRLRSPQHVAKEISYLHSKYQINDFRFQDDLFTINPNRIREIFENFDFNISYRCFARADTLTKEMCKVLAETGCKHVSIGVESGSNEMLQKMNKNITFKKIKAGIINAKEVGLMIRIYLIVGFPGETDETIKKTINNLNQLPFDEFTVYPLIPYPGTRLFNHPKKFKITWIDKDFKNYIQVGKNRSTGFVFKTKKHNFSKIEEWRSFLIDSFERKLGKNWSSSKSKFK